MHPPRRVLFSPLKEEENLSNILCTLREQRALSQQVWCLRGCVLVITSSEAWGLERALSKACALHGAKRLRALRLRLLLRQLHFLLCTQVAEARTSMAAAPISMDAAPILSTLHVAVESEDAGSILVLESKGSWLHAGYHLTGATAGPALLSLPYAFAFIGWGPGVLALVLGAALSFYAYYVLITIVEHLEFQGKRFVRFRDLADHVLGKKWSLFLIAPLQFTICFVTVIAAVLVGGVCMKEMYIIYNSSGSFKLYQFILIFGALTAMLAQLPSFHSLRHVNLLSLLLCLGYSLCATCGSIIAGLSPNAPVKSYTITGDEVHKVFGVFGSLAIIANSFGNAIVAEIQATVSPPVAGKMVKGLLLCYSVVVSTFISVGVSGYWAFGNAAQGNIFDNMSPKDGARLVPKSLVVSAYAFVFIQLVAISVVYLQPVFEVLEAQFADVNKGRFSIRNLAPRILGRSVFVGTASFFAAMLPFFGDINALMGALGYTPLIFVFPLIFAIIVFKPSKHSVTFWFHIGMIISFSLLTILGSLAAIGQLSLDASKYTLFADDIISS